MSDGMLTREALLASAAAPRVVEKVEGPGGQGFVFVRALNGVEKSEWERASVKKVRGPKGVVTFEPTLTDNVYGRFAVEVLCNEQGTRLFETAEAEFVGKMDGAFLARVYEVGMRLAGYTKEDAAGFEVTDEDEEKNS